MLLLPGTKHSMHGEYMSACPYNPLGKTMVSLNNAMILMSASPFKMMYKSVQFQEDHAIYGHVQISSDTLYCLTATKIEY